MLPEPLDGQRPVADPAGLIDHLLHAHELDRQRLAERIHDDPMQALVAVGLRMQLLAARLPEAEREHMNEVTEAVSAAMTTLRGLVTSLRPRALELGTLEEMLRAYVLHAAEEWALDGQVDYLVADELESRVVLTAFRLTQIAVEDVRRRGSATRLTVTVRPDHGGLLTEVGDNGPHDGQPEGAELSSRMMREWALSGGGWWESEASATGTTVRFWLPLRLLEATP